LFTKPAPTLIDPSWSIVGDQDALAIKHEQDIPSSFLKSLSDLRSSSTHAREGNYMKLCSIPVVVVEKWLREGFDIYKESASSIMKRLRKEDLDAFIATSKSI
jgi:hypothetical protein